MINRPTPVVATDLHQVAVLSVGVSALPSPTFNWYNGTTPVRVGSRVKVTAAPVEPAEGQGQSSFVSTLSISDVDVWDLNVFTCVVTNDYGVNQTAVQLTRSCKRHLTSG
jgi:hypothetical protein